eukprot:6876985-Prymnesium_polylepis.1
MHFHSFADGISGGGHCPAAPPVSNHCVQLIPNRFREKIRARGGGERVMVVVVVVWWTGGGGWWCGGGCGVGGVRSAQNMRPLPW